MYNKGNMCEYGQKYAAKYLELTLGSPYTRYKNSVVAETVERIGIGEVWDLGCNVSGIVKLERSLRFQLEKLGIKYSGLDLALDYFDPSFRHPLQQPESAIYEETSGVAGDIRDLPFESSSIGGIMCLDVIEHIDDPEKALSEIHRVLKPDGKAVMVVPSLYKLDAVKVPHILQKRYSTHKNRFLIHQWIELLNNSGFTVDRNYSRPLGIASGLLYFAWLNPSYVPMRRVDTDEKFSRNAEKFRRVKSIVSEADSRIDKMVLSREDGLRECRMKFGQGDVKELLELVKSWYNEVSDKSNEELEKFVLDFEVGSIAAKEMDRLKIVVNKPNSDICDNAFFGNSVFLVLNKRKT